MSSRPTSNQHGFTIFEVVLVVVAFMAIGAAGYFAYQARQDTTDYSVNIPHKKAPISKPTVETNVITFKELGVKGKLPDDIRDLTYSYSTDRGAELTTTSLGKGGASCANGALGSFVRVDKAGLVARDDGQTPWWQRKDGLDDAVAQGGAKSFASFYVYYASPQATCSDDALMQDLQTRQIKSVRTLVSNLTET